MKKLLTPIVTPFKADGSINFPALEDLVKKIAADGMDGIYACGSSAECFLLSADERKAVLECVKSAAGGAYIVAHVAAIGTALTLDLANHAAKLGVSALASVPPFYFNFSFSEVKNYYEALASGTNLPLMIYSFPGAGGANLTVQDYVSLLSVPNVTALKYTSPNYYVMERIKSECGAAIYSGMDECFLSALSAGADGAIGTTFNVMPEVYKDIRSAFLNGDNDRARLLQKKANNVTETIIRFGVLPATKYLLQLTGIDAGIARHPFRQLSDEDKAVIKKVYSDNIGL